jgi:hypothetical protein
MTMFSYNQGVPDAPNNPSVDQPDMLQNTISIFGIWDVDHVGFNSTGAAMTSGGQHLQVSFNGKNVPGALPTDPLSILYTNSGTASTISQMFYANQNGTFPINAIRAFGNFGATAIGTAPSFTNQFNVNTATATHPAGMYVIPLIANAVGSDNVIVLLTTTLGGSTGIISYSFTGGVLTILSNAINTLPILFFNFLIIQI